MLLLDRLDEIVSWQKDGFMIGSTHVRHNDETGQDSRRDSLTVERLASRLVGSGQTSALPDTVERICGSTDSITFASPCVDGAEINHLPSPLTGKGSGIDSAAESPLTNIVKKIPGKSKSVSTASCSLFARILP